ncbi:hypothetical protein OAP18_03210, partial [Gammaproteobacteria bacterium]|nr:hypothetical protein [Gammaproteobacteria bacterium]
MNIPYSLIASLTTLVSIALLFLAWKKIIAPHFHHYLVFAGWLCLMLSIPLWSISLGAETGTVVALCIPAFAAWLLIIKNATYREPVKSPGRAARASKPTFRLATP